MMRRQIKLMGWLFVSALAACTSETPNPADGGNAAEDTQKLVINLSDGGDRLTTRAGRPLQSSEPGQWVQHVTLYVTTSQGIVLQKEIDEYVWANATDYINGKQLEIAFRKSDGEQLPTGDYTVYAVAFSTPTDYSITPAPDADTRINAIKNGKIDGNAVVAFDPSKDFTAVLNSGAAAAEEIFAGKAEVTATVIEDDNCLMATQEGTAPVYDKKEVPFITLNRQVAGTIGYFTNIPATVKVNEDEEIAPTRIRLVASNKSDKIWFTSLVSGETVTATDKSNVNWIINGSQSTALPKDAYYDGSDKAAYDAYELYSIELSDFFPQMKAADSPKAFNELDLNKDGYVGYEDVQYYVYDGKLPADFSNWSTVINGEYKLSDFWMNPNSTDTHPQQLVAGSVFAGRFVIPFSLVGGKETLELQLLGNKEGQEQILKSWRVKVSDDGKHEVDDVDVPTGVIVPTADQDYVYNIYRNHMYSIGTKTAGGSGDAKPEPDGENGTDNPAGLDRAQDLVVYVASQWMNVHSMELEPLSDSQEP